MKRSPAQIKSEVERLRSLLDKPFLSLSPPRRAEFIRANRAFVSAEVNRILWGLDDLDQCKESSLIQRPSKRQKALTRDFFMRKPSLKESNLIKNEGTRCVRQSDSKTNSPANETNPLSEV